MPWPLFMVDKQTAPAEAFHTPGACWPMESYLEPGEGKADALSPEYRRDWMGKRPPLCVCLPDGTWWVIDRKAHDGPNGWTITGEPPCLTATPSVNYEGGYHGWLKDGVLSDDVGGRTYLAQKD